MTNQPSPATLSSPHEQLGIPPDATPAEIKAAYHARLRQYPAHSHPQDFKAIRAAYETLNQKSKLAPLDEILTIRPFETELDPESSQKLEQLTHQARAQVEVSLTDLLRLTF